MVDAGETGICKYPHVLWQLHHMHYVTDADMFNS